MDPTVNNRRQAFVVFRPIFKKENGAVSHRSLKKLLQCEPSLQSLRATLTHATMMNVLWDMLRRGVFHSERLAKLEFPDLFENESQPKRTRAHTNRQHVVNEPPEGGATSISNEDRGAGAAATGPPNPSNTHDGETRPKLDPATLPHNAQHVIATTTQRFIEDSCFEFARKWLPDFLEGRGYEYPTAVEVTLWPKILSANRGNFRGGAPKLDFESINSLVGSMRELRNVVVHREETPAAEISGWVGDAVSLLEQLHDQRRAASLRALNDEIKAKIDLIEAERAVLYGIFDWKLAEIEKERERQKEQAKKGLFKADKDFRAVMGGQLEEATGKAIVENAPYIGDTGWLETFGGVIHSARPECVEEVKWEGA